LNKKNILEIISKKIENSSFKDCEIFDEREYILIYIQIDIKSLATKTTEFPDSWVEVSPKEFKASMASANRIVDKKFNSRTFQNKGLKLIGKYQMLITGSEEEYWTRPRIDIHKFKIGSDGIDRSWQLRDIEDENNLAVFNKYLFGGKRIFGNKFENLKLPTILYGMGTNGADEFQKLPRSFLLNLTLDAKTTGKEDSELQKKQYNLTVNTVVSNFGRLLIYLAKLLDLFKDEYKSISRQSNEIRENALKLQMKINDLMVTKSDSGSTSTNPFRRLTMEPSDGLTYKGMEENLLLEASRYLSYLTEINQLQAKANYLRAEATGNIEKINQTFGLATIPFSAESNREFPSLSAEFKELSNSINYNFQNLKLELDHSQSTIRNTVDILKTFLESEQRMVSQRSGEAINWIVIVFAGLGLADALGNFVIFWLEGGSGFKAMLMFSVIMMVLIIVIVVLYFWYFKRPKQKISKIG
jgi:hypothetical protein